MTVGCLYLSKREHHTEKESRTSSRLEGSHGMPAGGGLGHEETFGVATPCPQRCLQVMSAAYAFAVVQC